MIQGAGLFAHLTVRANVVVVPKLLGWDAQRQADRAETLLQRVGLPADVYGDRYPGELSGGQRQRVGIARALAADPRLVLLDEPFGALDPVTREDMQDEFVNLCAQLGKTFVVVTHDLQEAVRLGHRIGVMQHGRLVRVGTPREVVADPGHPFVEAMLGRNRVQLRLMTIPVGELVGQGDPSSTTGDAPVVSGAVSVWDALTQCEASASPGVVVETDSNAFFVARQTLATVTDAHPGVVA